MSAAVPTEQEIADNMLDNYGTCIRGPGCYHDPGCMQTGWRGRGCPHWRPQGWRKIEDIGRRT